MKLASYNIMLLGIILLWSCNNEVTQQLEPKGTALGKMNEIVVIADDELWEGAIGDTFRFYFSSPYPILPQPEPIFDIRQFTPNDLIAQPLRKELRTYIVLCDLSNIESPTSQMVKRDLGEDKYDRALNTGEPFSSVGRDKWARGQLLVYLFGKDKTSLASTIKKSFNAAASRINNHDKNQLRSSIYVEKVNLGLSQKVKDKFGIELEIPGEYQVASEQDEHLWLRKDTKETIVNLIIKSIPYTSKDQLDRDAIISLRNDFGQKYIESDIPNNKMIVNNTDLPVFDYLSTIDNNYVKELRGTWEMTEEFVAGPFATYLIVDEQNKRLIYVDGFIFAPGKEKRNMMMQMDYMVKSITFTAQQ